MRDAENGEALLGEIEWSYGFATRLLSGADEGALTFRGVVAGRELRDATLVVDVGGGSTELIAGRERGIDHQVSLDLGCVRLTERFLRSDPPTGGELAECARAVRSLVAERVPDGLYRDVSFAIGVAGTVTTLAAVDLGLADYDPERIHGHRIAAAAIDVQLSRLAALPLAERRRVPGLHPERAPVIVAGAIVVRELLDYFDLAALEVSERDLLHGAALEAAALREPAEGPAPPGAYTCC